MRDVESMCEAQAGLSYSKENMFNFQKEEFGACAVGVRK